MDDLVAFLRARLDETEAAAKATEHNDGPYTLSWTRGGGRHLKFDNGRTEDYESVFAGNWDRILIARDSVCGGPLAAHIARHDPATALREAEAGRQLIDIVLQYEAKIDSEWGCSHGAREIAAGACRMTPPGEIEAFRVMAALYSDHPDYRQEWALEPTGAGTTPAGTSAP